MIVVDDMLLFRKLFELKSFTATAESMQMSRSLVSKRITRLEDGLGVQLLNRSTRRLELTEAGRKFFEYCSRVENTILEAEATVSEIRQTPRGNLNLNAPITFGQLVLPSFITRFLKEYPEVKVNLSLSDKYIDVIEGGYDVVVRIGRLKDSSLKARRIGSIRLLAFAHRSYLEIHGVPTTPRELAHHNCLEYRYMAGGPNEWQFLGPDGRVAVRVNGNFSAENGVPLIKAAQAGLGIALQPDFVLATVEDDNLVFILEDYCREEIGIYLIYPSTRKLAPNSRAFIDFMVKNFSDGGWPVAV